MGHQLTTCTFCGVGCGIILETAENRIVGAYPSMSHPANRGRICVRGWHVHEVASAPDRLRTPLIRDRDGFREASWDEAYGFIAERLQAIRKAHGPDAIGFLASPRCSNEESYLLQKMARAVVGTNNVDHGTGVHRINTIRVLSDMLGFPAATGSLGDLERADVVLLDTIDLARQLPTIGGHVIRAKLAGAKIIVTGMRRHRLAEHAHHFLQTRPHSEVFLFGAMAKVIVDRGLIDHAFIKSRCRDYDAFVDRIRDYDVLWAAERCGVSPAQIEEAAVAFGKARSAMILYSSGVEARGMDALQALVDLALLTGNVGKPGAGIMPLAEQNNLQGGRDMGLHPALLPGYRPVGDPEARAAFERLWGAPVPDRPGLNALDMLGARSGEPLRALWIDRHNPVVTATRAEAAQTLQKLDLVVLQHLFLTETALHAHVILPVVAYGEEQVTFTSTERRIQLARQVVQPPDGPEPAWRQIVRMAERLGAAWSYASSADVMAEIGRAVPSYEGASHDNLARDYGRQWPCTRDHLLGTPTLYADGAPERRFRFALIERPAAPPDPPADFPFVLTFGYSLFYWHGNVLVRHSETLKREYGILLLDYPDGFVEISGADARALGVRDGGPIRVVGQRGAASSFARITDEVKPGTVYVPYFLHDFIARIQGPAPSPADAVHRPIFVRVEKG